MAQSTWVSSMPCVTRRLTMPYSKRSKPSLRWCFDRCGRFSAHSWPAALLGVDPTAVVAVQVLEVGGVERVVHALEPVARQRDGGDGARDVSPRHQVPVGHERGGLRPEIGPDQPGELLDRVRGQLDLVLVGAARRLSRLLDALALEVVDPPVVAAADAVDLGDAVEQVHAAVGAVLLGEPEPAVARDVQHEVFAEQADGLGGLV